MCVYCIHYQLSSPFVLCHTPSIRLHLFHLHWALTNAIHGSDCMLSKRLLPIHTTIRGLLRTQWHGHFFVRCITMWTVPSCSNNRSATAIALSVITKLFIVHRGVCASYMLLNCSAKKDFDVAHDCDTTLPTVGVDIVCVTSICDEVAAQHCCIIPFRMIPEKIILWASTTHTDKQMCNMHVVMIICKRHYKTRNMCSVQMRCGPRLLSLSKKVKSNFLSIAIAQIQFTVVKNGFWLRRRNGQYLSPFKRPSSPWIF